MTPDFKKTAKKEDVCSVLGADEKFTSSFQADMVLHATLRLAVVTLAINFPVWIATPCPLHVNARLVKRGYIQRSSATRKDSTFHAPRADEPAAIVMT